MDKLLQVLIIGVIAGSIYGFIAIGITLVYRTTGVLNIAHGGVGILTGYVAWDLITLRGVPYYIGIAAGVVLGLVLGFFFEWLVLRRLAGQPALQSGATLALFILLQGATFLPPWWAESTFQVLPSPLLNKGGVRVGAARDQLVSYDQIVLICALAAFSVLLYWVLRRTRIGLSMRAVSDDRSAAPLMGIREGLVTRMVWTTGFGLSALTTMLLAPMTLLDNQSVTLLTVKALTVAFVGGLVSVPLTVAGAIVLGILETAGDLYWATTPDVKFLMPFLLMLAVLAVRYARPGTARTVREDAPVVTA